MQTSVLQVQIIFRVFCFKLVYFSICLNLGQFVSTWISLGQAKNTGHRPQVIACQYRKYPKHLLKLTLGLIIPKQKFLGLMSASIDS